MKKIISMILMMALVMSLTVGCGGSKGDADTAEQAADQTYNWRFAHEEIDGSVQDLYVKKFAEIMKEKSGGKINIEVYPVGQIGDATQQCELLQNGGIEFAMVSPGNTGTIVPENQLFSLHFLLPSDAEKNREILNNSKALNEMLSAEYLKKDIKVLQYWSEGPMQWTSSKPLNTPADFKGFKMRTMPSPMIVAAYQAYDANPTPVPYMEVYSGLQLHMIDGEENPLFAIDEMKFCEVQDYLTLANASYFITTTSVNPDFFNGLPKDVQDMITATIDELRDYSFEIEENLNKEALENIKATTKVNIATLTPEQTQAFREASMSARDKYLEVAGEEGNKILETLVKEVEAIESK